MIKVLNKDKVTQYVFPEATWSYSKRRNEGGDVRISIPRAHYEAVVSTLGDRDLAKFTRIAYFVELFEDDLSVAVAKVTSRDIEEDTIDINAVTEEILLDRVVTPENYGLVYQNWDLADVARDLAYPFYPLRVAFEEDWVSRQVSATNVDETREPGVVMLSDAGLGEFNTPGEIIIRFEKSEVPDFDNWGRFRWAADFAPPVSVWVSYRYGETTGTMGSYSTPIRGALTEEKGIEIATLNASIVDFKFTLETTESTVTPRVFGCELIARQNAVVGFHGTFPVSTGVLVRDVDANDSKGFTILTNLCEKYNYEFEVRDGFLHLAESLGVDRSDSILLRSTTNTNIVNLGDNDDEIINVLKAYGSGVGLARSVITVRNEDSINEYGEYHGSITFDNVADKTTLTTKANEHLAQVSVPKNTFVVETDTLYGTDIRVSDTVRVVDPRLGIVETATVEEVSREFDSGEGGGYVQTITIGHRQKNVLDVVRDETQEEEDAIRELDLPAPLVFSVTGSVGGVSIRINPFINSRAVGSEVHASTSTGFTPSDSTIIYRGGETSLWVTSLAPEVTYYFVARAYDVNGEYSEFTGELSAIPTAASVPVETIEDVIDDRLDEAGFLHGKMLAQRITPPDVVDALPALPNLNYPINAQVYLTTDETVYENLDDANWTVASEAEGQITVGQIAVGAIGADQIAANAISAEKLAIGTFDNLVIDPTLRHGLDNYFVDGTGTVSVGTIDGVDAVAIELDGGSNVTTVRVNGDPDNPDFHFAVNPDESYYWSFVCEATQGVGVTGGIRWHDSSGTFVTSSTISIVNLTADVSETLEIKTTVPTGATYGVPYFAVIDNASSIGTAYFHTFYARRRTGGELIVDGAITAGHIAAGTITANHIAAGSITADKIDLGRVRHSENLDLETGDLTGWIVLSSDYGTWGVTGPAAIEGSYGLEYDAHTTTSSSSQFDSIAAGEKFAAVAGEQYRFEYTSFTTPGVSAGDFSRAAFLLFDSDENLLATVISPTELTYSSEFTQYSISWDFTVPDGYVPDVAYIQPVIQVSVGSSTNFYNFDLIDIYRIGVGLGDNTRLSGDGIEVFNSSDTSVLKLGNIDGRSGVPSNVDYGLWGILGTGVFIQGAPKVVAVGTASGTLGLISAQTPGEVAGYNQSFSLTSISSVVVPSGRQLLFIGMLIDLDIPSGFALGDRAFYAFVDSSATGTTLTGNVFPGGSTYTNFRFFTHLSPVNASNVNKDLSGSADYVWVILEVDS